ncbi:ABC transporter ATP-binding protein [Bradyrhizobium sp. AUGA SZCCT0176]|uniref:ABC transporter ATP-binding protein n=1 Tax=unclassified Bradyrhizobium TaxID=2631580 RepID=UPI001BA5D1C6|nr:MULTISPECIES: ABC transporter ATP-binding protein [unclassified Bradyrhizobium]MBR1225096.1 ABC transporter ATP-binding protein [Bradyrhizobium sp. AUGA SZCCT0176]MBR1281564.1 ABC transporter ATP-binding protein [Bradyrhizobium sp. AUGA SZCCT0177]
MIAGGTATRKLSALGITAGYDRADVLKGVTVEVKPGTVTCILGANGAGKSTLIRTILGLNRVRKGEVFFGNDSIANMPTHKIAALGIATVPEGNRVLPRMTVLDNLKVGGLLMRDSRRVAARMEELFETFPRLRERRGQLAGTLSGGERSMLSIARGLMTDPELVVFDEPSLGLSPLFVSEVFGIVRRLKTAGLSILLVEQNVRQTLDVADYGYVLVQGQVVAEGDAESLKQNAELHKAYFGVH